MNVYRLVKVMLLLSSVVLTGCGGDELPPAPRPVLPPPRVQTAPVAQAPAEPVKFVYHGDARKDPFIALNSDTGAGVSSEEVVMPNLSSLSLKGLYDDGKGTVALINGGGITYVLKDRRLYDNRQRLVKGVVGIIRNDSVIVIGPNRTTKELKLHEK